MKRKRRTNRCVWIVLLALLLAAASGLWGAYAWNLLPGQAYTAEDFHIPFAKSGFDFNENAVDDYLDLLQGAKKDAKNHPKYDPSYISGGYPEEDRGVCTDVIWRAFREAGLSFKDMVDKDIQSDPEAYGIAVPDPNIDFRRVGNLHRFFEKYGQSLTTDIDAVAEWQAGDIVFFGKDAHIGMISDKRNRKGHAYVLHNAGQPNREEDLFKRTLPSAHYRIDFQKLQEAGLLIRF
uniref:DUF1287 domain-containing protein n=1 Tax=Ndongobacter massiliensis TaxID=1871025 RepID=UPI000930F679|nr:DUF1287 domain-containing protein [Ndongobacter massiliensis]